MDFVPPSKRFRLFFDETGNGDLNAADKSPNERYLSITGIVIRQDHHDRYVTRRLNLLKANLFGATPANPVLLHRRDIMRREGRFSALRNDHLRKEFDARLAAIIAECTATAFTASIDKLAHKEKYIVWQYSPYHYVMECLVERFVKWLDKHDRVGDVMGEARDPTHDKHLRRAYARLYRHGNNYHSAENFQARLTTGELKLVRKGADVAGVQLADALAHPAHRALKFAQLKEPQPEDYGTFLVRILERYSYDRHPERGIRGFGTKWLP
jgi:hypothetical protein